MADGKLKQKQSVRHETPWWREKSERAAHAEEHRDDHGADAQDEQAVAKQSVGNRDSATAPRCSGHFAVTPYTPPAIPYHGESRTIPPFLQRGDGRFSDQETGMVITPRDSLRLLGSSSRAC